MITGFLEAQMAGKFDEVAHLVAPECEIVFSGGRPFRSAADITAFNAKRYAWVRKRIERTDVAKDGDTWLVYSLGALYGAWPDGTEFDGNRYVDRFEIKDGVIVRWEVWNDSGERLLEHHGIDA
ncbi:MAG: nuclear transport factor 2 family protein [Pseudomonadota bacterium]